jgi:ubiquinone/menaquinone biosynthesis C-methylase UbiE
VEARYDVVADFYEEGWPDSCDDPATQALFALAGEVAGLRVLDLACGHGRVARQLAHRGAAVVGIDISAALVAKARAAEQDLSRGVRYIHADAASHRWPPGTRFDMAVCNFGLSDIDDLGDAIASVSRLLPAGGAFVFSMLHPCFPGGHDVSGSWPSAGSYHDEKWWRADGTASSLRRKVGASHRTLSTYLNTLRRQDLWLDALLEPAPAPGWAQARPDGARMPVFLAARCLKR